MAPEQFHQRLTGMAGKRIAVLGDYMLDLYLWGNVTRISPEAPVPVVEIVRETEHLGGAANVANNLVALGAVPFSIGVIGGDGPGGRLLHLMRQCGFQTEGICVDDSRSTTIKTRLIAHTQHVVRIDRESRAGLAPHVQQTILEYLRKLLPTLDALILEDYNKGVLAQPLLQQVIALAQEQRCLVMADPKFNHFLDYHGVTVFKPNRKETEDVLGVKLGTNEDVVRAGKLLLERLRAENVLITLGAEGMALFQNNGNVHRIPTRARRVHDVSGAGDTVIATLTAAMAAGASIIEAATLANIAAGVVVAEVGAVPIDRQKLMDEIAEYEP